MSDTCTNFRHGELVRNKNNSVRNRQSAGCEWGKRHAEAFNYPLGSEIGVVELMQAAAAYADSHRQRYSTGIGDDGVLGEHWEAIVRGILGLLNGDCGRLDCGTLDGTLRDMLAAEGFDCD
jgi:hypothetical protein